MRRYAVELGLVLLAASMSPLQAQQATEPAQASASAIKGLWEGPWYRGMTSGKVKIEVGDSGGTIVFTNLDNFGDAPHPLTEASFDGQTFKFRTEGEKGGPLTAALDLNSSGTQMKGMGKFDGFPLRFEIKRAQAQ